MERQNSTEPLEIFKIRSKGIKSVQLQNSLFNISLVYFINYILSLDQWKC